MGIQATEHARPKRSMKGGVPERTDPEYKRHGTTGIIASGNAAAGEIVKPMIQPARTEEDFLTHIESAVSLHPNGKHIFIADNLNTHMSESMVRTAAREDSIAETSLGIKRKCGILENKQTRAGFLADSPHRIVFMYTPKHCSRLNQIECWFSIITGCLLNKRSSFTSVTDLEQKIKSFINYYNQFLKKPFQWNYKGKLLRV